MEKKADLQENILNAAMRLAEATSWEKLHLHEVATELNISLEQIRQHYPQKDDLVEAWYDRADASALRISEEPGFLDMGIHDRLHKVIMAWLDALAEHKTISRDMLLYKLEPAHIHLQVLGILRISRTVQWFRETAHQDSTHLQRILEEVGLTTKYMVTFLYWMNDKSEYQQRTRDYLKRKLKRAKPCVNFIQNWFGRSGSVHGKETKISISD